ncbi:MAG: hypothetical protein JW963_03660 [Anaerolineales bacterium]|nr:hypothetical protein [Anaerolineales bacterium]
MYTMVLPAHSYLRWAIVIFAFVVAVKFAIGWLRGGQFKGIDRGLSAALSGLLDLQAALGLVLLVGLGLSGEGFPAIRFAHAAAMFIALVLAHLPARWKNVSDQIRFRNSLFCILGALALIYVGVMMLPVGWTW